MSRWQIHTRRSPSLEFQEITRPLPRLHADRAGWIISNGCRNVPLSATVSSLDDHPSTPWYTRTAILRAWLETGTTVAHRPTLQRPPEYRCEGCSAATSCAGREHRPRDRHLSAQQRAGRLSALPPTWRAPRRINPRTLTMFGPITGSNDRRRQAPVPRRHQAAGGQWGRADLVLVDATHPMDASGARPCCAA